MFLCLSSGARPRYRRDIIRLLAMPAGTRLPFRYDTKWIADSVRERLEDPKKRKQLNGERVLIAYIDQSDPSAAPKLIPCRVATIADAVLLGSTASVQLRLAEFAHATDLEAFRLQVESATTAVLPGWSDGQVSGSYWLKLNSEDTIVHASSGLRTWEQIVGQVASCTDFADQTFFYLVEAIAEVASNKRASLKDNAFRLAANKEYELRLYHFHPTCGDPDASLALRIAEKAMTFTTTPTAELDSRYDLKRIRFHTADPAARQRDVLSVLTQRTKEEPQHEFDLPITVRGSWVRRVGTGLMIGIFLAAPPIVTAFSNATLTGHNRLVISVTSVIAGFCAGIAAAFGLRRSV